MRDICRPFFPESQYADIVHAATCLEAGAIIVTNDAHFLMPFNSPLKISRADIE
jgi:predicted nucleic acid-binding protein